MADRRLRDVEPCRRPGDGTRQHHRTERLDMAELQFVPHGSRTSHVLRRAGTPAGLEDGAAGIAGAATGLPKPGCPIQIGSTDR